MGSKRERAPGVWELFWDAPRDPAAPGKRRRRSATIHGTADDADAEMARQEAAAAGSDTPPPSITFGHLVERYLTEYASIHLARSTAALYSLHLRSYAAMLHPLLLSHLKRHHLSALERYLRTRARRRNTDTRGAGLAPLTVAGSLTAVRSVLAWGEDMELIDRNPARHWRVPTAEATERPTLDVAGARTLLASLSSSPFSLPILCLLLTNLRLSELRGLRWADVNLTNGTYVVRQQWQDLYDHQHRRAVDVLRSQPKSRRGARGGGFSAPFVALLQQHQATQLRQRAKAGTAWRNLDLVFTGPDGSPLNVRAMRRAFYTLLRAKRLPRIHLHDLRHTWVALQLEAGTPEHEVIQLAGHTERVNRRVYQHVGQDTGLRAADRLWRLLDPGESNA